MPSCTVDGVLGIADDRNARREAALDARGRDRGRDREHGLLGEDQRPDLAEQALDVLRLDRDHHERRSGGRVVVRERRLDAIAVS